MATALHSWVSPFTWLSSHQSISPQCLLPPQKSSQRSLQQRKPRSLRASEVTSPSEAMTKRTTLKELCRDRVPLHILERAEEVGYVIPTDIQEQALPAILSGRDCILHAQTGSGKTLAYLLGIFAAINFHRSTVQALILVPTRELGMQVSKVARILAAKHLIDGLMEKSCTVMALLDGGTLKRHQSWLKAEPPQIVVATIVSLSQMLEKKIFRLDTLQILVVDEVDFMFNSSKQVSSVRKLLTSYSTSNHRQTVFASASIPQHNHFLSECIQQKWTKRDVVHVHVHPVDPMPSRFFHRFVSCGKDAKLHTLLVLLKTDAPRSCIIFVADQSEKSKKAGNPAATACIVDFLRQTYAECKEIYLLDGEMHINARSASLSAFRCMANFRSFKLLGLNSLEKNGLWFGIFEDVRQGCCFLVATDLASRGVDLPETTHIYNFDLPRTATDYLHRAGRTGRRPFSDEKSTVTTILSPEERFVLQRYENELMFKCEEVQL